MAKKLNTQVFIERSESIHGKGKYDYSKSTYINSRTNVTIGCPVHGDFLQSPESHAKGRGCMKCSDEVNGKATVLKAKNRFVSKAIAIHGSKYNYSKVDYQNSKTPILIGCPIHGDFKQTPHGHISAKNGCQKCGMESKTKLVAKTTAEFISESGVIHNYKYTYSNTEYTTADNLVSITCPIHGEFQQKPKIHLQKKGCPQCGDNLRTWSRSGYITLCKDRLPYFYILRIFNETEEFFKLGITVNSIERRYDSKKTMPYNYEVIKLIRGEAGYIWDLERDSKETNRLSHYTPKITFNGSATECFSSLLNMI